METAPAREEVPLERIRSRLNEGYGRLQSFRERHVGGEIALFFTAGFLFDIFTLSRIDDRFTLIQQGAYLAILAGLMLLDERHRAGVAPPPLPLARVWRFSEDVIHFLFGSLLSSFTLFYLKSTSGFSALLFLAFICGLLVANELPAFRRRGPIVRFALLGLCLTSYCALLLPILSGFLSDWLFLASVILSCAVGAGLVRLLTRWTGDAGSVYRRVAVPGGAVQGLLVVAYFAGAIPPVPLSVQYIGIYHAVVPPGPPGEAGPQRAGILAPSASTDRTYQLQHLRPWWKVWHHGDQEFAARPGDTVYCFVRVFAPRRFQDVIYVHWRVREPGGGWRDQGRTPLTVRGGRDEGFRTFATKQNYRPGRWRVEIEIEDGRDLGAIHFNLRNDPSTGERTFTVDRL